MFYGELALDKDREIIEKRILNYQDFHQEYSVGVIQVKLENILVL